MNYDTAQTLSGNQGNNAFSWNERKAYYHQDPTLTIPSLKKGNLDDLVLGTDIVFEEFIDGKLQSCTGLESFIEFDYHHEYGTTTCIVFDNHNHALYFWIDAIRRGIIEPGFELIHIDEHSDLWDNPHDFDISTGVIDPSYMYHFVNHLCNVGNYIQPALRNGLIKKMIRIENEYEIDTYMNYTSPRNSIFNLDLDIFAPELDFIPDYKKINITKHLIKCNKYVTIATSPYFINQ